MICVRDISYVFQLQNKLQQHTEQLRLELETAHKKSSQQLQSRLTELESSCRELTERKYKNESVIRDLKIKLVGAEEVSEHGRCEMVQVGDKYIIFAVWICDIQSCCYLQVSVCPLTRRHCLCKKVLVAAAPFLCGDNTASLVSSPEHTLRDSLLYVNHHLFDHWRLKAAHKKPNMETFL